MRKHSLLAVLSSLLLLLFLGCGARAQQATVYNNFGPGNGGWDYDWGLGWTVAGVNVPNQYGVEQALSFQATASGVVTDIWMGMWNVPLSPLADTVTVRLARNNGNAPPTPQDVMEEWTLTSFQSWSQWNPPQHLQGSGLSYLEQGQSYWVWVIGDPTTWCGWCMNLNPALTAPHTLRRENQSWLPVAMETASALRVDVDTAYGLAAESHAISQASGGSVALHLAAGAANASRGYLLFAGASGTAPGLPLPGGLATLPLNPDAVTTTVLGLINTPVFANFAATLYGNGAAVATLDTLGPLPPSSIGFSMSFAYCLYFPIDYASNPITVTIGP